MIKDDIIEAMDTLGSLGVTEENIKKILFDGVTFDFSYGSSTDEDRYYNILEFASMLRALNNMGISMDVNAIVDNPTDFKEVITIHESVASLSLKFNKKKDA